MKNHPCYIYRKYELTSAPFSLFEALESLYLALQHELHFKLSKMVWEKTYSNVKHVPKKFPKDWPMAHAVTKRVLHLVMSCTYSTGDENNLFAYYFKVKYWHLFEQLRANKEHKAVLFYQFSTVCDVRKGSKNNSKYAHYKMLKLLIQ